MNLWIAAFLGIVEGLTEFVPISSTGHLILAANVVGLESSRASSFLIFIQLGAMAAVLVRFRRCFLGLLARPSASGFSGRRALGYLLLTTAPALAVGWLARAYIRDHLFAPRSVAWGLAAGALWILAGDRAAERKAHRGLDDLRWCHALGVGLFQCLALWPGVSRAAATIMGGLTVGLRRPAATEYSFLAAVPVMLGACLFALGQELPSLTGVDCAAHAIGFLTAFATASLALEGLLRYVSRHTLVLFGIYRLVLAAFVLGSHAV